VGQGFIDSVGTTTALALRSDGATAWIAHRDCLVTPAPDEVYAYTGAGKRLLESAAGINPTSLRLVGDRVRWLRNRTPASAPL